MAAGSTDEWLSPGSRSRLPWKSIEAASVSAVPVRPTGPPSCRLLRRYIVLVLFAALTKDFGPERSLELVRHALGPGAESLDIEIRSVRPWTMNALVADSYDNLRPADGGVGGRGDGGGGGGGVGRAGRGTGAGGVLLIGDAAHQFPPAGGFGLNTGVQVHRPAPGLGTNRAMPCTLDIEPGTLWLAPGLSGIARGRLLGAWDK